MILSQYMVKLFYSDHHSIPLPENHRFPMEKYKLLRLALQDKTWAKKFELLPTTPAKWSDILLAHDQLYIDKLLTQEMPMLEKKAIGFPLNEQLILRSRSSVQGFISSCFEALQFGFSGNLSGGTHHAHRDRGEGFCVFNDFAVAALKLLNENLVKRILILDLDVHQGNGNSSILKDQTEITIVSLHGEHNYPFRKVPSSFDYGLPNHCDDQNYLNVLSIALERISDIDFDIILYQAGVDVLASDKLGKLSLTLKGVKKRDEMVFEWAGRKKIPVALALGGGYTSPLEDTIEAHLQSFQIGSNYLEKGFFKR